MRRKQRLWGRLIRPLPYRTTHCRICCSGALLLLLCWMWLFPGIASAHARVSAHAILLRSNPARDAILKKAPTQIQMWFSEDLSPAFSTAYVTNATDSTVQNLATKAKHLDIGNAHIAADNAQEIDVSLKPDLSPAIYLVVYRTQSAADGHILNGTFLFTVAEPDGTVPTSHGSPLSSSVEAPAAAGQLDGATSFTFLMITLVELGVVFWVGAQLWQIFVFRLMETTDQEKQEEQVLYQEATQRFEYLFSIPTLLLLLCSNIGVLVGQALVVTGTQWTQVLDPTLLGGILTNGYFGTYWVVREVVVVLALLLAISAIFIKKRPIFFENVYPWLNLLLGLVLLAAMSLSGHAAAVSNNLLVSSVLIDWLHLLAAALWIGGMFYLATIYLPILKGRLFKERAAALLKTLPRYSPLAIMGVIMMAVSGPTSATIHLSSPEELITTAYGLTLLVKIVLVVGLLLTSAVHVFFFRPTLKKAYQQYSDLVKGTPPPENLQRVKELEGSVRRQTSRLIRTLRWEPLLGVAVLVCTGLLNIFAGMLPATATPTTQHSQAPAKPFAATLKTSDGAFTLSLNVTPNQQGSNMFVMRVLDKQGVVQTNIGVSIYTTLLGMDMGTTALNLQPDGKGNFSANGDFSMGGNWQLRVDIRTPDNILHEAQVNLAVT